MGEAKGRELTLDEVAEDAITTYMELARLRERVNVLDCALDLLAATLGERLDAIESDLIVLRALNGVTRDGAS